MSEISVQELKARLSSAIADAEAGPAVITPQSLDLVHLRTALWFHSRRP